MFATPAAHSGYGAVPVAPPPYSAFPGAFPDAERGAAWDEKPVVLECPTAIRNAFISKVYAILTAQLLATGGAAALIANVPALRAYVLMHAWPLWTSFGVALVALLGLAWHRERVPHNYAWLALFTTAESLTVGTAVSMYSAHDVALALLITGGLFVAMTLAAQYAARRDWDLSFLGMALFGVLTLMLLAGLASLIFPFSSAVNMAYCILGVVVFAGWVLFDTWAILTRFSPDEYVSASVSLYLDILNIFLFVLRLLRDD